MKEMVKEGRKGKKWEDEKAQMGGEGSKRVLSISGVHPLWIRVINTH